MTQNLQKPTFKPVGEMSPEDFAREANVSRETLARLTDYANLLVKWQSAINLVGGDTLDQLWRRHMLDSAQIGALVPSGTKCLTDFGSGAGFPGLALAIILDIPVHLIESSGKKVAFLREVTRLCKAPVTIHHARIEELDPWPSAVITARAVAPLARLLDYALPFCASGTICLFPKGIRADEELTEAEKNWNITAERHQSITDSNASILCIKEFHRVGSENPI
jgi:16S rRNA (guanine527-N7)-methyltransferase